MRKRRTRQHIIAGLSVNHIERYALLCGHTVERVIQDYGLDLILWTYDPNGEIESGQVFLQMKATDLLPVVANGKQIAFNIRRSDLEFWLVEAMPIVLIVYDAPQDTAYYLYIQSYFESLPNFDIEAIGETVVVHIPLNQVVDNEAIATFQQYKNAVQRQVEGVIRHV